MRKFLIAIVALAFVSSTPFSAAFAQDKTAPAPGATSTDTMSKGTMKKHTKKKTHKSAKKTGDDTMTKKQ
ncbi:MAG TPA: hypothetical protein VKR55_06510 [Bradyrhizobium sp.]|uniref:hypothetical protein n=1 Tax=Bradyrhizobium sp. TaxID=376 RepID=UPI002C140218|nr:hypothetical protein [Bradyrhizobium sp.]HLZ01789.1 hypothetical protein [Bradyrhizobium sp.]